MPLLLLLLSWAVGWGLGGAPEGWDSGGRGVVVLVDMCKEQRRARLCCIVLHMVILADPAGRRGVGLAYVARLA